MEKKKSLWFIIILLVVVIIAVAGAIGFIIGNQNGQVSGAQAVKQKYLPILNAAFPPPPSSLSSLTGTVKSVYGATITMEVKDPNDYLPHVDGSPVAVQTRTVSVSPSTKLVYMNYGQLKSNGEPTTSTFSLNDLRAGDIVTAKSSSNILNAQNFSATEVDLINY